MVDGTTIPIFEKPHYFGESFYDRKAQYSINSQIINTLNQQIIDYATGFNGSRHDTHCFGSTRLSKPHEDLSPNREWCWGDVGYPLQSWLMIPYKIPNRTKENRDFNYALSRVRIRSEHAIGYLKGQFQSLKELQVRINNRKDMRFASYWIQVCIILHAFVIDHELEINQEWLVDGITWEQKQQQRERNFDEKQREVAEGESTRQHDISLSQGKRTREALKLRFFCSLQAR